MMKTDVKNFAEVELVYKNNVKPSDRAKVSTAIHAVNIFRSVYDMNKIEHKEMFYALYLNRNNHVLGVLLVSEGGLTGTVCDVRVILQGALKLNACGIILCHNHPSGSLTPSDADKHLTKQCCQSAKIMDMQILDHVILTADEYYSFSENKLI